MKSIRSRSAWAIALDFLFPPACLGCKRRGHWLCRDCRASLERFSARSCLACQAPLPATGPEKRQTARAYCPTCQKTQCLETIASPYLFTGTIRQAIHRYKYRRARHLAQPLGELLVEGYFAGGYDKDSFDLIVSVPLHPKRLRERTYNQSELMARELALSLGIPFGGGLLRRVRETESQMSLPAARRRQNVQGAFAASSVQARAAIEKKRVLLVDDVCTTGNTLKACAQALVQAGARSVVGLTLARAFER